jgi:hypothetical protein
VTNQIKNSLKTKTEKPTTTKDVLSNVRELRFLWGARVDSELVNLVCHEILALLRRVLRIEVVNQCLVVISS